MDGSEALDWLSRAPSVTALFTDFDGTLSPIVLRPEDARPLPGVPDLLKRLAARMLVVAVASGRPVAWLVEQLELAEAPAAPRTGGAPGGVLQLYGLHGLERWTGSGIGIELEAGASAWQTVVADARSRAIAAGLPDVEVEDKRFGVTLHWRNAPDQLAAEERAMPLARRLAASTGLITRPGKTSVELVPPIGIDKGTVVRNVVAATAARRVVFLGDDTSDILAFEAVDQLVAQRAARSGAGGGGAGSEPVAGLKIAVAGVEIPRELAEAADIVLSGPEEAAGLLASLAERLEAGG